MDETETESAVVRQIVGAIVLVVGLTAGIVALLLAGLILLFNLSVSYRKSR